ncbi:hypothetical protein ALC56_02320 [Trachymyrmex septentrionalis]|uniref:Uncharacterized protein n=1 Tax=Trachymyrmex septentrionalis TaxID=34720 RepID=A0A151K0N4_9HYME|nr:hypothetical protein ALC56_02320 [Trachymyrmex septentrionalis]
MENHERVERELLEQCSQVATLVERDAVETIDVVRENNNNNDADDDNDEEEAQRVERYIFKAWDSRCATFEMTDILNIKDEPIFDDRIVKIETHTYNPFANTTFGYSDGIRIPI